ncbi:heme ABC exporter ATP-binding protein CcmA [Henriciella mobilis]|mgnify:CR=1 FL=1|uniref:Heme ABC exporter ATP-binding protein CcmA n=1 Tax=Henriciella mobilis TaxID=2305467 RepID=A0A399RJI5_9PROT|nr:heme ABC exporter ATP-binding protein CcmA [Henriciella mobilis]RIJ17434.1 heme ABC exporter ATP-binding protein CcmA [Henriciella mobilis]RIJ25579.1 heme ABC exporter ATP-binding protein CcmA [Henriciella mobilis]RIJ30713.1 heme ABC exporter ATP-binding protein CcmA [Henriciella mobilis]
MTGGLLIEADGLGAVRGERILFSGLHLSLRPGEALVLRGPNGSGKSTLLRMLAGLSQPATGEVKSSGAHHWLGHRDGIKPHETPRQHLTHWARVWGSTLSPEGIAKSMGLERPMDVPGRLLSAGQRRRTALGRLLLVERPIWLLDEPFNALDAEGRDLLASLIAAQLELGGGVIAALHGDVPFGASREVVL